MLKKLRDLFFKGDQADTLANKNRLRFESIISDPRDNYLEDIYKRMFDGDASLTDGEILGAYVKFSNGIQTNTFAAAELEWATVSVLCHFRPGLTETLVRRGLLSIVYSLGDNIDWFTVRQFIDRRILAEKTEPYGGWPLEVGIQWLKDFLPKQKEIVQNVLTDVIRENNTALGSI